MDKSISLSRVLWLIVLGILPLLFPFGGRETYLIMFLPSFIEIADGTYLPWLLMFCYIAFPLYWAFYGYLFCRWQVGFKASMILGNLPIFLNAVGEILYYVMLGYRGEQFPVLAFLLGSHIDKVNISHIGLPLPVFLSICVSVVVFLLFFYLGYSLKGNLAKK